MGLQKSAVIPVASLSAICGVGLVFIAWWFPRTFAKGNAQELILLKRDREERERRMAELRTTEGGAAEAGADIDLEAQHGNDRPAQPREYRPPVAGLG